MSLDMISKNLKETDTHHFRAAWPFSFFYRIEFFYSDNMIGETGLFLAVTGFPLLPLIKRKLGQSLVFYLVHKITHI